MFGYTLLVASADPAFVVGIEEGIAANANMRVVGAAPDLPGILDCLAAGPADVLLLDQRVWRQARRTMQRELHDRHPAVRVLKFCKEIDLRVVEESVASGIHGCVLLSTRSSSWLRAVEGILRDEIWMPRELLAVALHRALQGGEPGSLERLANAEGLTERERDVLQCVAKGMTNKEIARNLGISHTTVKTHLHHMFEKLKVSRRLLLTGGVGFAS